MQKNIFLKKHFSATQDLSISTRADTQIQTNNVLINKVFTWISFIKCERYHTQLRLLRIHS
jgi:hypothetical protein